MAYNVSQSQKKIQQFLFGDQVVFGLIEKKEKKKKG